MRDFDQTVGIRAVLRADDENEINVFGHLLDCFLAVLRGVADVVRSGSTNRRKTLAKAGHNFLRVVQTERGLCEKRQMLGVVHVERIHGLDGIHHESAVGRLPRCADNLLMVAVADQDDSALFAGKLEGLEMDFGDKGAGGVNDLERAVFGLVADGRRHAVGAEDEDGAVGDFADGLDKDGAAAAQLLDHVGVVDDLMVDVHRRAVGLECQFYYIYRADHAGAETSRADAQKHFSVS